MVLPTKELLSTLTPFTVLTPEDDGGIGTDEEKSSSTSTSSLSPTPSTAGTLKLEDKKRSSSPDEFSSATTKILQGGGDGILDEKERSLVSGTTTLGEARLTQDDIDRRRGTGFIGLGNSSNRNSVDNSNDGNEADDGGGGGNNGTPTSNKILNLLNARNVSFLSNSTTSSKFSEDELFSDLKSRFIEKHFRTILRSQKEKDKEKSDSSGGADHSAWTLGKNSSSQNTINTNNGNINNSKDHNGFSSLLKPLKIITVERPEPQLDLPRNSYYKSAKAKFMKMHDQAKSQAVERYLKLCASLRSTVWPQLYPLQVLLEVLLSNLFVLIVAPFAVIAVIFLCFIRLCIGTVLKIRYKGRYKLMAGSDAAWVHQYFANDSSFLSLYVIQGDCSISRIRERIMKSVINCQDPQYPGRMTFSKLRCRVTEKFGFYCWETLHPMDFCIDDHVRYITNDPSAVLTEEQVLREIQRFIDQPLPEDAPQWQILVVPKFLYSKEHDYVSRNEDILEDDGFGNFDTITVKKKPGKKSTFYTGNHYYALVWRINHALMDGLSAANCLQHCIADMPVKLAVDPLKKLDITLGMKIGMYFKLLVFGSRSLLKSMTQRDLNCFHGPGLTGPKNLGWSRGISLDAIRKIRRKNEGTTTTAVLASAVGGSLRGLAMRKNNPVPTDIRAGITCALLPYPNIRPQNRFTVAHLKLKLELESHIERLKYATGSVKELVRGADIVKNYYLIQTIGLAPKHVIPWFMDNCEATCIISNIPGPTEQYTIFQGQKLVDIIGWNTIKGNTAIGVCLLSYCGRIRSGVIADGAALPSSSDVPGLIEELEKELCNLATDADVKEKDVFMDILT